ncbi:MAG: hypothetical protein IJ357_06700 [Oscillospiraceae bacterium]|nr:hypothetical protein [Oscillospiraceae bacterium]
MKFRSPRLPVLFTLQFFVTLTIPLFLHFGVQGLKTHQHLPDSFQPLLWAGIAVNAVVNHLIKQQTDEYSIAALHKAEARCFPWACMWMILCCVPTMLGYGSDNNYLTVYMLSCAVPVLYLVRAVLFWLYDRHGMEWE